MRNKQDSWRETAKRKTKKTEPSTQPAQIVNERSEGEILEVFVQVRKIVMEQLGVEEDEVKMETTFIEDLGADSLDIVELIMAFEEEFNIEIPDEEAEKIKTIGDAVNLVIYGKVIK